MRRLGLGDVANYYLLLQKLPSEWNDLVEAVVVTESWFFRDQGAIAAFVRLVIENWLPAHPTASLRVLSVPCAAGEEPYSLVMALLDAGVPPTRLHVLGMDISARALARAERGVYGKNAFRGKNLVFRKRYFRASEKGFALTPTVRQCVRFSQANVFGDRFLSCDPGWDFIFCRNLLIYLDRPSQAQALARLSQLLAPAGLLFVGPAEQAVAFDHGFVSANLPSAFAFHRTSPPAPDRRPTKSSGKAFRQAAMGAGSRLEPRLFFSGSPPSSRPADRAPVLPQANLEAARRLADEGRLREAAGVCEAYLREKRDSAQAYYLLGLVRDACGDSGAIDCYRKALYLEPHHYESLVQMALLLQKRGDPARARTFRSRANRLRGNTAET